MLVRPWWSKQNKRRHVILADETQDKIQMTTVVGLVVKMGDLCYQDKEEFQKGAWCNEANCHLWQIYLMNFRLSTNTVY